MKKIIILLSLSIFSISLYGQKLINKKESVFKAGEQLKYRFRYGFFTAAEATLQVKETEVKFNNKEVFQLTALGRTAGSFNIFYKVRNRYDSYIDKDEMVPYLYTEDIREANYRRRDKARFYQQEKKIVTNKGNFKSTGQTFDIVSAYYFARGLDLTKIKNGDKFSLDYFLDDGVTNLTIQYLGKERVKTSLGNLNCLKFSPSIQPGRIFRKDSKLFLWITDDNNRIPVKAQVEILVGSVTMELTHATGLKYPLVASK
ncbi:MAG: DUF3108 domain-containing protein [Flavobacterium sp.]|nr:DUF3108 domain-containing protein [Pedobacter sp.]